MGNLDLDMAAVAVAHAPPPGFIAVPATTLPGGVAVPAFAVARWLAACGPDGQLLLSETMPPWVRIGYRAARLACARAGVELLTELQALAIAHDIAGQAANWTGGAVGAGRLFQGPRRRAWRRPTRSSGAGSCCRTGSASWMPRAMRSAGYSTTCRATPKESSRTASCRARPRL